MRRRRVRVRCADGRSRGWVVGLDEIGAFRQKKVKADPLFSPADPDTFRAQETAATVEDKL